MTGPAVRTTLILRSRGFERGRKSRDLVKGIIHLAVTRVTKKARLTTLHQPVY
jgi:hypothetical protein